MNIANALRRASRARVPLGAGTLVIALALTTGTAVAGSSVNTGYFGGIAIISGIFNDLVLPDVLTDRLIGRHSRRIE